MTPANAGEGPVDRLLREHAGHRERVVDDHLYSPALSHGRATFRLQLFTAAGLRPVALVTQTCQGEGASLINRAEPYAEAVWKQHCPDDPQPPIWIQHQLMDAGGDDGLCHVEFTVTGAFRLASPRWRPRLSDGELAQLVGTGVDAGRGQYTAPEPEPERELFFEPAWVVFLPRPDSAADRACRPAGISLWRVLIAQILPRRGGSACGCWYHQGDWHHVSRTALVLLRQAQRDGVARGDLVEDILARASRDGVHGWDLQALYSLLTEPIQTEEGIHINGRHRTQAMLEAGVRRTLVGRWRFS